jgi:hypothetical protein
MPQRPVGVTPDRLSEQLAQPASTAPGPALARLVTATRVPVVSVTPGFGPLLAIYLPAAPRSPIRAGRGRAARPEALALRVVSLFAEIRRHRAFQGRCVEGAAWRLRSSS